MLLGDERGVGVLLVARDRLVLDAVVGGELRVVQGKGRGRHARARRQRARCRRCGRPDAARRRSAPTMPSIAASTFASSNGSCTSGTRRLITGSSANASPRRAMPRTPGRSATLASQARLGAGLDAQARRPSRAARPPSGRARARAARCAAPCRRAAPSPAAARGPAPLPAKACMSSWCVTRAMLRERVRHHGGRGHEQDAADGLQQRPVGQPAGEPRPSRAPGIDAAAPTASTSQSGGSEGRWPITPATPTRKPIVTLVPTARAGTSPTILTSAGIRSEPEDQADDPAQHADHEAGHDGGRDVEPVLLCAAGLRLRLSQQLDRRCRGARRRSRTAARPRAALPTGSRRRALPRSRAGPSTGTGAS